MRLSVDLWYSGLYVWMVYVHACTHERTNARHMLQVLYPRVRRVTGCCTTWCSFGEMDERVDSLPSLPLGLRVLVEQLSRVDREECGRYRVCGLGLVLMLLCCIDVK
jgi:hypothetical protein